jgi:hypothetical protein
MEKTEKITAETIENNILNTIQTLEITRRHIRKCENTLINIYRELKEIKLDIENRNYGTADAKIREIGKEIEQLVEFKGKWTE